MDRKVYVATGPKPRGATKRPVTHHLSRTLQDFVGSVVTGDPKTCWLVDSEATCHIVSEKWVKHYTVSFLYWGQLILLLHDFESVATQWVFTTVSLANLLWLFLLGSCPFHCLLCCLLDGETQIWLGDLRLAFCFWWCSGFDDLPRCMRPPVSMWKFS